MKKKQKSEKLRTKVFKKNTASLNKSTKLAETKLFELKSWQIIVINYYKKAVDSIKKLGERK